jgi:class 3 adenylate cyclase/tetratricopeptide (TPR) repeat protein
MARHEGFANARSGCLRELAAWLEGLGLARYIDAFEQNQIDFDTLPHLTEPMLEKIGLPLGPRVKLLAAISGLVPTSVSIARTPTRSSVELQQAERRQITVMFCDLVDSTRLASSIDPEEFRWVMQAFQKMCGATIERHRGHISQYRGDAVEAYFGWPVAHEDAAEQAVRAALEIIDEVKTIPAPQTLSMRVGICTGIVVISEAGADGDPAKPSGAVGETLHVAARLQSLAPPDGIVIAEITSRLISSRFEREDLGPQQLKGVAESVRAFRIRGVREDTSRFEAAQSKALTPLVGRQAELALLRQRWSEAKHGEGQAIFISGVAGIGKSRIVYELEQWLGRQRHVTLMFQCLPHCMQSAFFPVIQRLQRLAEFTNEDSDTIRLSKLERMLARVMKQPEPTLPFTAQMLSVSMPSGDATQGLTTQQIKAQTLRFLAELLSGLGRKVPVFCVLEDAHWIDPSTQELLDLVLAQLSNTRILLVVTHRPDYQLQSQIHVHVSTLTITRLGRRHVAEMARLALGDRMTPTAVVERIIQDSDAIPLFVEELARGAVQPGKIERGQPKAIGVDSALVSSIPETLRDSLMARLDRAPDARRVAQMAAVIGREFPYNMLSRISSLASLDLNSALDHLEESAIIQQTDARAHSRYAFKHALLRDVAYESLLKSHRREIHAKVAAAFEQDSPELVNSQPELLAYHYNLAGDAELAARFWLLGGRRAQSRSANVEAKALFENALESLASLPPTPERVAMELDAHLALGVCSIALHGYSAGATRRSFERACELSIQLGEPNKELQAMFGQWGHFWMRAQHDRAMELSKILLAKAKMLNDSTSEMLAYRCLGSTLFTSGQFLEARDHLERAIALGNKAAGGSLASSYAVDPAIAAQLILAWDLWILGFPGLARGSVLQALDQALSRAHPYTVAFAHYVTSAVHLLRGQYETALDHATRSFAISTEHRINLYTLYSRFGRGCALARLGQTEQAMVEIRGAIEEASRSKLGYMRGFMLGWLASVQSDAGDGESAIATVEEALRSVNDVSGRAWEAELRKLRGDLTVMWCSHALDEAERSYHDAIALAQNQSARSLELRATSSLARLLRSQGRNDAASARLAPIFGWFTEGHDTIDLIEARRLLRSE